MRALCLSTFVFVECCVFNKQSQPPILCNLFALVLFTLKLPRHTFFRSYGVNLPSSFSRVFLSALEFSSCPPVSVCGTVQFKLIREAERSMIYDPGRGAAPDLLVVNPPRRGIGAELAGRIEASGVRRVLYSSCNPQSLARDLGAMPSLGARRARLFDMFPHTDHAEVLVELVRRPARARAPLRETGWNGGRGRS